VKVGAVKDQAEFGSAEGQGAQQCYRVGAAGDSDSETRAGLQEGSVNA
jgi:hypothetical protein